MAREFLRITPELVPGTFQTAGVHTLIDIDSANSYTVRPKPFTIDTRTAGAYNRRWIRTSKKHSVEGNLNLLMHGSMAAPFVDWAVAQANVLKSYTVDYCVTEEDTGSTIIYSRDSGCYIEQAQLTAGESDQLIRAQLQIVAMARTVITITEFPTPALTDYPTDALLVFEDATAGLQLGGVARLDIETFNLTIKNMIDKRYFVSASPQLLKYCGRDIDWTSRVSFKSSVPRTAFEAQTAIAGSITFGNGTHSLVIGLNSKNYYNSVADQIDHSKVFLNELTLSSFVDPAIGDELTLTAT